MTFGTIEVWSNGSTNDYDYEYGYRASLEITGIESNDVPGLTFEPSMFTLSPNGLQTVTITFPSSTEGDVFGQCQYFEQ